MRRSIKWSNEVALYTQQERSIALERHLKEHTAHYTTPVNTKTQ